GPVLLEPVMRVTVLVPSQDSTDVVVNLQSRRGSIQVQEDVKGALRIRAHVPLSGMFGYGSDLRARTHGRGSYTMELESYQRVAPGDDNDASRGSFVGAPLKPAPSARRSGIALPEPDETGEY